MSAEHPYEGYRYGTTIRLHHTDSRLTVGKSRIVDRVCSVSNTTVTTNNKGLVLLARESEDGEYRFEEKKAHR